MASLRVVSLSVVASSKRSRSYPYNQSDRPTFCRRPKLFVPPPQGCRLADDDHPFIVLTETKFSFRCIPVWDRYSTHRTRVEKKHM